MLASMAEREKNRRKASMKNEELQLPPFGRLGSLEQPPVWLRPHKGEQISICDGGQSQGWVKKAWAITLSSEVLDYLLHETSKAHAKYLTSVFFASLSV